MYQHLRCFALVLLVGATPAFMSEAAAEQVRYHFVPADACGGTPVVKSSQVSIACPLYRIATPFD